MLSVKKLNFIFLSFFSSISLVFAEPNFLAKPFVQLFGEEGIGFLIKNATVVASLIYLAYLIGFFNIFKIALKPVFGAGHKKEAGTVALMLSFIGVTGMFYIFGKDPVTKKITTDSLIVLFGGTIGFIMLALVLASLSFSSKSFF